MNNECNVVQDLLPLYAEDLVSPETAEFVADHLADCEACAQHLARLREPTPVPAADDGQSLKKLRRRLLGKRLMAVAMTVLFLLALAVAGYNVLNAEYYLSYEDAALTVTELEDGSVALTSGYGYSAGGYWDYAANPDTGGTLVRLEMWTSELQRRLSPPRTEPLLVEPVRGLPLTIYYTQNNGQEDMLVYGESVTNGGVITLPRLALGYYLIIVLALLAVLLAARLLARKQRTLCLWLDHAALLPSAYLLGHLLIMGVETVTYSLQKDFARIVFVTILLYPALLLAYSLIRRRRERRLP